MAKSSVVDLTSIEAPVFAYRRKGPDGNPIDVKIDMFELSEKIAMLVTPKSEDGVTDDMPKWYDLLRKIYLAPTEEEAKANGVETLTRHQLEHLHAAAHEQLLEVPERKRFFDALQRFRERSR